MGDFVNVFIGAPDGQTAVSLSSADKINVSIAAGFTGSGTGNAAQILATYTAGEALSGQRLVKIVSGEAFYYSPESSGELAGITKTAANQGEPVEIVLGGEVNSQGWGLTADTRYYANTNGAITANPATPTGRLQFVGVATSSEKLIFNPDDAIELN